MALKKSYTTVKPRRNFLVKNQARSNSQREVRLPQLRNPRSNPYWCWACIPSRHTHPHTSPWPQWSTQTEHSHEHSSISIILSPIPSSCWHHRHMGLWPLLPFLWLAQFSLIPVSTVAWPTGTRTSYYTPGSPLLWVCNLPAHGLLCFSETVEVGLW